MSAETAINSSMINTFNLLRPWDSKVEKLAVPVSSNTFLNPASLPGLLSPMLMPHLTSLTPGTSSAPTAASTSALLSQVPLLSSTTSIASQQRQPQPQQQQSPQSQPHQHQAQRATSSQTSLSLLPPPPTASGSTSSSMCSHLTTLSQGEDKEQKREHRRRDNSTKSANRGSDLFDNLLSSYREHQIGRGRCSMQNLFPFNLSSYPAILHNNKPIFRSPMDGVLRCSTPSCLCECFAPGKPLMRVCAHCNHGWIAHAMEKLNLDKLFSTSKFGSASLSSQNIPGFPTGNTLFDIASLMLFGTHALPVRLKILLDRLLCSLEHDELVNLLHAFGWTYEDYSRGYMLQDSIGNILTKWIIVSKEEEIYIIQLFLKFPETKTIAQNFVLSETMFNQYSDTSAILANKFKDYELKKLVDCTNSAFLPKNSLLNINSLKSSSDDTNTHNSKTSCDNSRISKALHQAESTRESESKSNRTSKPNSDEVDKQAHKPSPKSLPPVNHISSCSPKSDKPKDKSQIVNQRSLASQFNSLGKLENMVSPFEYRKKESKNSHISETVATDPSQFLSASVSASSASPVTNPLFSLASPFNPLLNPALLTDPSKYHNASEYCKIDLSNPAAAAAAAAALNKNLDFTSFNTDSTSSTGINSANSSVPGSDAINLTQNKNSNNHGSSLDKKSNKHLRKSNNPIKRRWDPLILSSLTTNPATGKKRVQCNVCLKTFCDKGALKIHFSAVHLREMHKCTVDGCNMMFSSRRSRNRHSANPNPKLHTPNFRRKINPHDGRTANPYPVIPAPPSGSLFGLSGVNSGIIGNFDSSIKTNYSDHSPKADYSIDYNSMSSHSSRATPNEEMLDETYDTDDNNTSKDMDDDGDDIDCDDNDDICIDLSVKDDTHKSPRKRKNFNPIKFSLNNNNNENYQYLSTDDDDSSSDIEYNIESKRVRHPSNESDDNDQSNENDVDTDIDIDDNENHHSSRTANDNSSDSLSEQNGEQSSEPNAVK